MERKTPLISREDLRRQEELSDYINMFDRLLKEYLASRDDPDAARRIETKYRDYLNRGVGLL